MQSKKGVLLFLLGIFAFCFRTTLIGLLPRGLATSEILVYQNLFCMVLFVPIFIKKFDRQRGIHRPWMVLFRGLLSFVPQLLIFEAARTLQVSDVILLNSTSPLIMPLFSLLILHEGIHRKGWPLLFIGYLGVVCIIRPGFDVAHVGALWALMGAMCTALAIIVLRTLHQTEQWCVLLLSSFVTPLCAGLLMGGARPLTDHSAIPIFLVMGALVLIGQLGLTLASHFARPTILAPYDYMSVLFALVLSWIFYQRIPSPWTLIGDLLIVFSGLLFHRQQTHQMQKLPAQ